MQTETNAGGNDMAGKKQFNPIPQGRYTVALDSVKLEESKRISGCWFVKPTFKVQEGTHAGRLIFDSYIINHPTSAKAVEISEEKLGKMLNALGEEGGLGALEISGNDDYLNLNEYKGKPLVATVTVDVYEGKDGNVKTTNKIKGFSQR